MSIAEREPAYCTSGRFAMPGSYDPGVTALVPRPEGLSRYRVMPIGEIGRGLPTASPAVYRPVLEAGQPVRVSPL